MVFQTPEKTFLCQKGFLSEVFLFGGENGPGTRNVLFPHWDFFRGFPFGRRGHFFMSKTFPLRGFPWHVFGPKGFSLKRPPLSCFPSPGQVLPEPLLKPLFGHMLKPLCHTLSCNGFQCVAAWGYHPEHAQNRLCSIQWLVLCLVEASCSQGVHSKLDFEISRIFSEIILRYAH